MATANTAAQPQALAQLADIQEPLLVNDWYLAPGWWLLATLVLTLLWLLYRKYRQQQLKQAPKRFALKALAALDKGAAGAPAQITALLKRWLLSQNPGHPALSYSGEAWRQFLLNSLKTKPKAAVVALPDLLALHYQRAPQQTEIQAYADFAALWLQYADLEQYADQQKNAAEKAKLAKGAADV
ncbi:DUF4381 domain-containing protein [Rheinheimera sp. 4Y26]|uniref:DUF4381 domain-containing protein n=1 Tax=Rheinheimera sp. 4Y26 TaxID=2977811 RepID=UPI0021B0BC61|nr:DUF4381 domain-containing protein [Rheinheimera sp. 4Y26]MCT6700851.1 DUF4381 domain-containing protein [Rheinheimera sp. 4Y26]